VLWKHGSCKVREVHETLAASGPPVRYTTVLKQLQVMQHKGLVTRDARHRAHVYRPLVKREAVRREMTRDLLHGVFEGSRSELVLEALGDSRSITLEELEQIRDLLSKLEGDEVES